MNFSPIKHYLLKFASSSLVLCVCLGWSAAHAEQTCDNHSTGFFTQSSLKILGGVEFTIEIDTSDIANNYLQQLENLGRQKLRANRILYHSPTIIDQVLTFRIRDESKREEAKLLLSSLADDTRIETQAADKLLIKLEHKALEAHIRTALIDTCAVLANRINGAGFSKLDISQVGTEQIRITIPSKDDFPDFFNFFMTTGNLSFRFVDENAPKDSVPIGSSRLPYANNSEITEVIKNRPLVTGQMLADAQPTFDMNNRPAIAFRFNSIGARRFAKATTKNVGRIFAIVLDDEILTAPMIQSPILGGQGIITGNFTEQEVVDLSNLLRSGALPAQIKVLKRHRIGPEAKAH